MTSGHSPSWIFKSPDRLREQEQAAQRWNASSKYSCLCGACRGGAKLISAADAGMAITETMTQNDSKSDIGEY